MANETANRAAEALLPPDLFDAPLRAELLADTMPAFIAAADGRTILWSSHEAARRLAARDGEGLMASGLPPLAAGTERLGAIGRALDANSPKRLERLRFTLGFRSMVLTCLVRPVALMDGKVAMLVSFVEARPVRDDAAYVAPPMAAPAGITPPPASIEAPRRDDARAGADSADLLEPAPVEALPVAKTAVPPATPLWLATPAETRRPIRFVFTLDRDGVVEKVTPPLAEAVGADRADIIGMPLAASIQSFDPEAAEKIRGAILGGQTWSGVSVLWPVGDTGFAIPVALSALPLSTQDEGLTGFSGFGRCHIERAEAVNPIAAPKPVADDAAAGDIVVPMIDASDDNLTEMAIPADPDVGDQVVSSAEDSFAEDSEENGAGIEAARAEAVNAPTGDEGQNETAVEPAGHEPGGSTAKPAETAPNVVSLRLDQPPAPEQPPHIRSGLSMSERNAFREIAKALGAKFDPDAEALTAFPVDKTGTPLEAPAVVDLANRKGEPRGSAPKPAEPSRAAPLNVSAVPHAALLDLLPVGILVLRGETPLFANRTLLDLTGYPDFFTFAGEDGSRAIFRKGAVPRGQEAGFDTIVLSTRDGEMFPVDAHLQLIDWEGGKASLISLRRALELEQGKALRSVALDLKRARSEAGELRAILDTATDGVATLDEKGRILSINGAAEALFGVSQNEVTGENFTCLLRNESHAPALDYFEGLRGNGVRSVLNDGREVTGREKKGGAIPLFMTLGRISDDEPRRYCAVLRDLTAWKRAETELTEARQAAELASAKKSDFLTKISHEIRTPMNAIIGFAEVMMEERLGPVGNTKYKEYLADIRTSGNHVVSLVNDLLDLSKIEAGRMEMDFAATDVNAIVASCVGIIQPQANANRVLVRTQLAQKLPPIVADERSIRQIVLNMLSNATRFTEAGGQVIVATSLLETGEAVIRIRDTGIGMSPREIEQALEPFRQVGTRRDHGGTGLGLPLTKALVEANRANFAIRSKPGEGTMIEITFPSTRVLAE